MSLRSRSTHPGAHFTDKANTVFEWFKISSTSWLAGPALFCSRGVGQGNDLLSECLEYQLPNAGWFSGRSSALGGAVSRFGHLYARPIPNAKLEMINLPPASAALACRPRALPPTKVLATLGPLSPDLPLSFAQRGGQVDSEPLRLGRAAVLPADPGARGLLPAGKNPTRPPAASSASRRRHRSLSGSNRLGTPPPPRPASPRAGDRGTRASGAALGAPDSRHWSGGASRWCPRASPKCGSFRGFQFWHPGALRTSDYIF